MSKVRTFARVKIQDMTQEECKTFNDFLYYRMVTLDDGFHDDDSFVEQMSMGYGDQIAEAAELYTATLTARVEELTRELDVVRIEFDALHQSFLETNAERFELKDKNEEVTLERDELKEENARLTERLRLATTHLRDLSDLQNGPPFERYSKEWSEVMDSIYQFLSTDK